MTTDLGDGGFVEVVIPNVVVGIHVLLIVVRLVKDRAEAGAERDRALARPAERIEPVVGIGVHVEVPGAVACKEELSAGIPGHVAEQTPVGAGIGVK